MKTCLESEIVTCLESEIVTCLESEGKVNVLVVTSETLLEKMNSSNNLFGE